MFPWRNSNILRTILSLSSKSKKPIDELHKNKHFCSYFADCEKTTCTFPGVANEKQYFQKLAKPWKNIEGDVCDRLMLHTETMEA